MRTQSQPHVGAYVKVTVPDRTQGLPYGLVGEVVAHSDSSCVHVRFPGGIAIVDLRTIRPLARREVSHALGLAVPHVVSI